MKNAPNHLDDHLRRRLSQAEVPPPAFVWPEVEKALRRRRRRLLIWLFWASLASAGIWSVWHRPGKADTLASAQAASQTTAPAAPQGASLAAQPKALPATALSQPIASTAAANTPALAGKSATPQHGPGLQAAQPQHANPQMEPLGEIAPGPSFAGKTIPPAENITAPALPAAGEGAYAPAERLPTALASLMSPAHLPTLQSVALATSKHKAPKRCYDFHSNRRAWLLDAYGGVSYGHKSLRTNNPEYDEYVQDRLKTERRQTGFNAGLRASYLFNENFVVRTGVHYDQGVEEFEYIDPNYIKYTVEITKKLVNGEWVTVPDTVNVQYGSNYVKTYNRLGLLDIPLQAGLELRHGATGISLNLGGSINLLFWKRGSMLTPDGNPASFKPADHQLDVFRPKVGLSLLGSIQWFCHLGPRTRVFAEPYYRYILNPVTQAAYPVEQRYGIGGIRLGLTRIVDMKP